MSNVYYNPENFGLEIVDSFDRGESYEFDMLVLWRHIETGKLFWATDSGCSCPTPFENYFFTSVDQTDLHSVETSRHDLERVAKEMGATEILSKI